MVAANSDREPVATHADIPAMAARITVLRGRFDNIEAAQREVLKDSDAHRKYEVACLACNVEEDAIEEMIAASPARTLRDAAVQLALAFADVDTLANGADEHIAKHYRQRINRLLFSALNAILKIGNIARDEFLEYYAADHCNPFPEVTLQPDAPRGAASAPATLANAGRGA